MTSEQITRPAKAHVEDLLGRQAPLGRETSAAWRLRLIAKALAWVWAVTLLALWVVEWELAWRMTVGAAVVGAIVWVKVKEER